MGVFHELVTLVNRTPVNLSVRFDGQETTLKPGENQIPKIAVMCAKNQNPVMGTQSGTNPTLSGAKYLVGVKGTKDNCKPMTKEEWQDHLEAPSRMSPEFFQGKLRPGTKDRVILQGTKPVSPYEAKESLGEFQGDRDA